MQTIFVFSGPCGCGKSTLANAYAEHLVHRCGKLQAYVIHGDDFHAGFVETERRVGADCPGFLYWPDILAFNWECILAVAEKVLDRGLDVILDYVVEDELPRLKALAAKKSVRLCYVVLTAEKEELRQRLIGRGSGDLIERSWFLKEKLEGMPENSGHLYCISGMTVQQEIDGLDMSCYEVEVQDS